MLEQRDGAPIVRVRGLPEDEQCLKHPGFKCNCVWADPTKRRKELRKIRQQEGAYSFANLFDTGLAENYQIRRKGLCEGFPRTTWDRIKYALWLFMRR